LLRDADLPLRLLGSQAHLDFLGPQDEPWLRVLLAELVRFEGRRARELAERLSEPLSCDAPYFKRRAASRVLWRLWRRERRTTVPPPELRARLFTAAAAAGTPVPPRAAVLEAVAAELGVPAAVLEHDLLGDVPGERTVRAPAPVPAAAEVTLLTNLAIAQAVLMRASTVRVQLEGGARPVVRLAKLRGLLVTLRQAAPDRAPELEISGPYALFRHTLLYGRALAELLPHLAWCARFRLRATAALRGRLAEVELASGDPIRPATQPRPFDSQLEARFARDFARLAPDWDLLREPEPVRAGDTVIFPDFLLRHRVLRDRWLLMEIAGFWTPGYIAEKLARLRQARLSRFLLCIDEARGCADQDLPPGIAVLRYRRRVDAAAVLRIAEQGVSAPE
jgi:predicted nuclease of restriction endonuclease-like RecB superfamily